ncbi:Nucleoporin nup85 [Mortierella alpina]|nr:Nucleoporin nup85 [Mortierella alpina]
MSSIPLIQPSSSLSTFASHTPKRSIFSDPTVDRNDTSIVQDLLNDQDNDDEYISTLHLNPSPISKGITAEQWTASNRTIGSAFRPSTNEIAVFVAGKKAAEEFITQMFEVFIKTTALDPYKTPELYRLHYDQYYEGIHGHLLHLCDVSKDEMETEDASKSNQELELMEAFASIWQLADSVFFTADEKTPIAFMLVDWIAKHVAGFDMQVGETLLGATRRLSHPDFWPYIIQCLLRGMKMSIVFMLEQSVNDEENEDDADALDGFLKIVRGMPSEETTGADSKSQERHRKWVEQCLLFMKSPKLTRLGAEAKTALKIMTGDVDTILNATDLWEEALSAITFYTDPNCTRDSLEPILRICVSHYLEGRDVSVLEKIKIAILEMDAITTVRHCGNFHPWLVAHLADVLQQYGYLDMSDIHLQDIAAMGWDSDIRDFFVMSYAQSLMSNPIVWEAIAGYLLNSGHSGRAMLSEWLCHVPLESSEKAQKVLKFCKDNGLTDSLRSINRVMGVEEEKRGHYGLALQHFITSKDPDQVARVVDNLMLRYLGSGNLDLEDSLDAIQGLTTQNVHIEFLLNYVQFHFDYKDGKIKEAGETLVSLLKTGVAPMKYWAVLMFDALPLLENKSGLVFDANDTYVMMRCLEDLVGSQHKSEYLQLLPTKISSRESTVEEKEHQLDIVRMSLVRNLSRSFVHISDTDTDMLMAI